MSQKMKESSQIKTMWLKMPRARPRWGAELPSQMSRVAEAVLGGKAQELQTQPGSQWASVAPTWAR